MGHGIAKNLLRHGFTLRFLDHPGNQSVDDLVALGAISCKRVNDVARDVELTILCVTGSEQVTNLVLGDDGILNELGPGKILMDCSTVEPQVDQRVARAVLERGARFADAPMTRTPREAEAGKLNIMIGGDAETVSILRPVLEAFAENMYHAGQVGAGQSLKLLHNFISLGNCVLLAEAVTCARRGGVDTETLIEVLASGGGDSTALRRLTPYLRNGDPGAFQFSLANTLKDLGYYAAMAGSLGVPATAANALREVLSEAVESGAGEQPVPLLIDHLARSVV